tara:strand:- start:258 stop:455 length:198 start_codon:yes stop_codon:yes gene_type:complete
MGETNDKASPINGLVICVEGVAGEDYTIKIEKPSGEYIKVLIPKGFEGQDNNPFGLNMVSNGHYI